MSKHTIRIDDLMQGMQSNAYDAQFYFDTVTGQTVFTSDYIDEDEKLNELLETEEERFVAIESVSSHEGWRMMDDFAETVGDGRIREQLLRAINGKGAFRRFKDILLEYPDVRQQWFIYEEKQYMKIAQKWAKIHELEIEIVPFNPENEVKSTTVPAKKLLILFGPPAVGKMTVGKEIAARTGLKLFHNHMTIELVVQFFDFGTPPFQRLVDSYRQMMIAEVAKSDLPGLVFTFVWALDQEIELEYVQKLADIFRDQGGEIFYAELQADLDTRLARNKTEYRLAQKATKRDVAASEERLLHHETQYKFNSDGEFEDYANYFKLDNTNLTAVAAAEQIITAFAW